MSRSFLNIFSIFLFAGLFVSANSVAAQTRAYRVSDRQVQTLITRVETRTDSFKDAVNRSLDRSRLNNTRTEDDIIAFIEDFERATDRLRDNFDGRRSASADVEDVLNRAASINDFVQRSRLNAVAQREWSNIRLDLNTLAQYYSVNWNWTNSTRPIVGGNTGGQVYIGSDANVRSLLARLETQTDLYRRELNASLDNGALNGTRSEDEIVSYVDEFERATDRLRDNFNSRRSASADVEEVLNRAVYIDSFMRDYRLGARAEQPWRSIRTDLDTLAGYYRVSWNWNRPNNFGGGNFDTRLTGTYRLNVSRSDEVTAIVDRALATGAPARDRQRTNLIRRLTPPEMLAVEIRNNQVTIASNTSPQVSFTADGVARTETNPNGRQVRITATSAYDGVNLSYEGDRANDFYVNFMPMANGQLRVVRRLYLEGRNETITVSSVYDKIENTARWGMVNNSSVGQNYPNDSTNTVDGDFVIPNNTRLVAVLNNPLSTRTGADGERFTLEVTSPGQYRGAIIEGYVSRAERSGRVTGRAELSLNFDRIRLRDGRTYRFTGLIDSVRTVNGDNVSINNEGAVRDSSQTNRTVTRAGIGAALGALIGAIAGGGSGAAVGAAIGAGAGAGTVVLQGRNDLELQNGTEFNITATSPANLRGNR